MTVRERFRTSPKRVVFVGVLTRRCPNRRFAIFLMLMS